MPHQSNEKLKPFHTGFLVWHSLEGRNTIDPALRYKLGLSPGDDAIECSVNDFTRRIHPDDLDRALEAGRISLQDRRPLGVVFRMLDRNGQIFTVSQKGWWISNASDERHSMMTSVTVMPDRQNDDLDAFDDAEALSRQVSRIATQRKWPDVAYLSSHVSFQINRLRMAALAERAIV